MAQKSKLNLQLKKFRNLVHEKEKLKIEMQGCQGWVYQSMKNEFSEYIEEIKILEKDIKKLYPSSIPHIIKIKNNVHEEIDKKLKMEFEPTTITETNKMHPEDSGRIIWDEKTSEYVDNVYHPNDRKIALYKELNNLDSKIIRRKIVKYLKNEKKLRKTHLKKLKHLSKDELITTIFHIDKKIRGSNTKYLEVENITKLKISLDKSTELTR